MFRLRGLLPLFVAVASSPLPIGCGPGETAPAQPNLLLIAVDTLRADHLGAYGYERPTSPNIDALLEGSVVFEDAQSSSSWTLPAFASLFTSLHTSTHRAWHYKTRLDGSYTTLAEMLREHGYATAAIVSHLYLAEKYGLHQGFEHYDQSLVLDRHATHRAISSPDLTSKGVAWLRDHGERRDGRPWFLWVHYFDPHSVYRRHEGFTDRFGGDDDVDRYDGEIAFTDHHIGLLLDALRERGLEEETVVAFVADHGEEFREHGRTGHGRALHGESIHVPFAIRAPGFAPRRVSGTVRLVDFAPTVLELLGVPPSETPLAGASLVPRMRGEPGAGFGALAELRLWPDSMADAYVLGRWKLLVEIPQTGAQPGAPADGVTFRLFDREADPLEQRDVSAEHPGIVRRLANRLRAERRAAAALASAFDEAADLEHSAAELEQLRELGYIR